VSSAFYDGVREAAEGTPYAVTKTDDGFDVTLDIVDSQWFGVFNKAGLRKVYTHRVKLLGERAYSITDESRSLEWVAGTPRLAASLEVQKGRIIEFGAEKVWAFDEHGRFGVVADYRFGSEEGRQLIEGIASTLGLEQRRGVAEKLGIAAAGIAIGGIVIGGLVVGVLAILGVL
jgi:hypothetical protein